MSRRARVHAGQALALRGWALGLLGGAETLPAPPPADAAAWELFLSAERCALPLRTRLRTPGEDARALLESAATAEMKRSLSARGQLRELDRLAARLEVRVVVLKGGVHTAEGGEPLDLQDLDVLVERDGALAFAAALEELGYARGGDDLLEMAEGEPHLAGRHTPHALPVEVHFDVPGVDDVAAMRGRATPLRGTRRLLRPAPADHLWHLLVHAAARHPERRGRIRDLLLIGAAAAACSADELGAVHARLREHGYAESMRALLEVATSPPGGAARDPFRRVAATRYLLAGWLRETRLPGPAVVDLARSVFFWTGTAPDRAAFVTGVRAGRLSATVREWPGWARAGWRLARAVRQVGLLPAALPLAVQARRLAARPPETRM